MLYFFIICTAVLILTAICCAVFIWYRNSWVYHNRMALIKNGTLDLYWDYDKMFYTFWIWDIEKMRSKV